MTNKIAPDVSATSPPSLERLVNLQASLTEVEVKALQLALEHVREHMALSFRWEERDAAMAAIGKVLLAARTAEALEIRVTSYGEVLPDKTLVGTYEVP